MGLARARPIHHQWLLGPVLFDSGHFQLQLWALQLLPSDLSPQVDPLTHRHLLSQGNKKKRPLSDGPGYSTQPLSTAPRDWNSIEKESSWEDRKGHLRYLFGRGVWWCENCPAPGPQESTPQQSRMGCTPTQTMTRMEKSDLTFFFSSWQSWIRISLIFF